MPGIDDLVAIDVHTHRQTEEFIAAMGQRHSQMSAHFGRERRSCRSPSRRISIATAR